MNEKYNNETTENKQVDTESVKCNECGSNMLFDPETQTLICPHCGSKVDFATDTIAEELDISVGFSKDREWTTDEAVVFACENCNAKVVLKNGETTKTCPFCGTAHVKKTDELAGLKPNALIPFAFGGEKALSLSKAWAKKRFFAPKGFKKNLRAENLNGVYTPCFTFDSGTVSYYNGVIGNTRTRVVGSGKNKRVQTYVVWRNIAGTHCDSFDDVLITAGNKFDQRKLDKVSPYQTNDGKVYEEKYLLGFMAYHYDNDLTECWGQAKTRMDTVIRRNILSKYVYDRLQYLNVSTSHNSVTYKYVMLPVYVGNFNYRKKLYNFYVNGSTGKVTGKTPKSPWKVLFTVLGGLALIVGIGLLLSL